MSIIKEIVAAVRTILLKRKIAQETKKIILQVKGRANYGYPFSNMDGLQKATINGSISLKLALCDLDTAALSSSMSDMEVNAYLYAVHCNMEEQIRVCLAQAKARRRLNPEPQALQPVPTAI